MIVELGELKSWGVISSLCRTRCPGDMTLASPLHITLITPGGCWDVLLLAASVINIASHHIIIHFWGCNSDNDCYAEQSVHYAYTDIVNNWWLLNLGVDRWEPRWTCTDQKVCEMQCDSIEMPESDQNIAIITDFLCNEQGERCKSEEDGRFYKCRDSNKQRF